MLLLKRLVVILLVGLVFLWTSFGQPSFQNDIVNDKEVKKYQYEYGFTSSNFESNIKKLFYPWWDWGVLWDTMSKIWFALFVIMLLWAGALFILNANNESELKNAKLNFLYILLWGFFFFGSVYIVWGLLWLPEIRTTWDFVANIKDNMFFVILVFMKVAAFFFAILMLIFYGFKSISAFSNDEKISSAKKWIINVILALIFIKIIDYMYYLALQRDFMIQAWNFLTIVAKGLIYLLWVIMILVGLYGGYLLIFSRWDEEKWKKFQHVLLTIVLSVIVIVLFLLIMYTLVNKLGG